MIVLVVGWGEVTGAFTTEVSETATGEFEKTADFETIVDGGGVAGSDAEVVNGDVVAGLGCCCCKSLI